MLFFCLLGLRFFSCQRSAVSREYKAFLKLSVSQRKAEESNSALDKV
jgi:hypothetical protein